MKTVNKSLLNKIWEEGLGKLQGALSQPAFETWILPLVLNIEKSQQSNGLILEAPDPFFKDWVSKNYSSLIQDVLKPKLIEEHLSEEIKITSGNQSASREVEIQNFQKHWLGEPKDNLLLNPRFTFENFVVGSSNRFAHAASIAVAESPARAYNPFLIYGGVGLGKTHLMQAICHYIKNKSRSIKICYLPSERFTNELINAIQHHSTSGFRQKYRNMDVLVIDDIHFIAGKESTQEEFFHMFNVLYDAHKQIVISSDRPPREISKLEERLVSRFNWGLITDIQPPDLETRVAILKKKVEKEPVNIPDDVIFFIAQLIKTNIRELEGALIRVIACSLLEERLINIDLTREILKDFIQQSQKPVSLGKIQECVANEFGIPLMELKTKRRSKNIVLPRQVAMYLSRQLTEASLFEIANFFGRRDHTTILYAHNKIKLDLERNNNLKHKINKIIQTIQR